MINYETYEAEVALHSVLDVELDSEPSAFESYSIASISCAAVLALVQRSLGHDIVQLLNDAVPDADAETRKLLED